MYLNVHSYFSLGYGTMPVETIAERAAELHAGTVALTDINNTMGVVDLVSECAKRGVKPVAGCEFRNGDELLYVAIALNNNGFREINETLTKHNISKTPYPNNAPKWNNVVTIYPMGKKDVTQLSDNEFVGVRLSQIGRLLSSPLLKHTGKILASQPVTFADENSFAVHRTLRAIDKNMLVSMVDACANMDEIFVPPERLKAAFSLYPDIVKNTESILNQCFIDIDFKEPKNKKTFTDSVYNDMELLRKMAFDGMLHRYGRNNREAYRRVEKELEIIGKMHFASYFLIAADIVRYSMSRGFYHVGRGSGANSIVAYCLNITDVDPIELDLYFERFLNPKRTSPPDFDIDYSWKDRDEVIQYVFSRYGRDNVALLGATITYRDRSVIREVGRVHGLPKKEIDGLCRFPERCTENSLAQSVVNMARQIVDFPNTRSVHAGGILITEDPITCYSALDMSQKGFLVTQWDMYVAERLRADKLDILSQRGIGHINDTVEMVRNLKNVNVDIHRVSDFKNDAKVKCLLREADTIGCFYIESPAMRGLLRKLKCDDYKGLVAASSIIRPGVAGSGMMRKYIQRFHDPDNVNYLHPKLKELLHETYGVMVYQEDVLKVCHHFAGLDLSDADVLRRMMSHKGRNKEDFNRLKTRFFDNCKSKRYDAAVTDELWRQIESFAGYSFSKAHSASYAAESFQSLYLKAYYPLEFMVAVINNFGGFYPSWLYFNELKKCGGLLHLPCVNTSEYLTSLKNNTAYIGFVHLQGLENSLAHDIVKERHRSGPYLDISDFMRRLHPKIEQVAILVRCGAFSFTGLSKASLLWRAFSCNGMKNNDLRNARHNNAQYDAFGSFYTPRYEMQLPQDIIQQSPLEDAYDELELLGFPVSLSWFDMLNTRFRGEILAKDMLMNVGGQYRMLGHLVSPKYVRTSKGELMCLANFIDASGDMFDAVIFPKVLIQYPLQGNGTYLLLGKVTEEFGHPSIEVLKMAKMGTKEDPRSTV